MRTTRPLVLLGGAGFVALAVALSALGGAGGAYRTGHAGPSADATTDLSELWAVPPVEVSAMVVLAAAYLLVAHRAGDVPAGRRISFLAGVAVILAAVCSPLGGVAQQGLLTAHMLQHTLIGAVAPLLLLLGVSRGMVAMIGPRGRAVLTPLQHPLVAFPLWMLATLVWLLPVVHHQVLQDPALWVVQQASFLVTGLMLWAAILELLPGPAWFVTGAKCVYMAGVFFVGLAIANVYWFSGTAFYDSHASAAVTWGLEPLEDQANAGTVMMVLHCLLAFGAISILFFRQAREGELRQRLIEAGVDPARVAEAIRAGAGEALAHRHGVSVRTRAGID